MNIVFFGSSQYSVIIADKIYKRFGLSFIVTKPGPGVEFAKKNNISVITPAKLTEKIIPLINNPDFLVVADYGLILPKPILDLPKYAPINIHYSLLPKYRGPTPAPSAILAWEKITGVSIIKMETKVDAGNILAQKTYEMSPQETTDSLLKELNTLGAKILMPVIENFREFNKNARKQVESLATYTPRLTRESGYIDLKSKVKSQKSKENELEIDRMVRAYYPWPGVWTRWEIARGTWKIVKLLPASVYNLQTTTYNLLLQVEGKRPMNVKDFINGYPTGRAFIEKLGII